MIFNIQNITKSPLYNGLFFRFWGIGILVFVFFQFYRGLTLWIIGWEFNSENLLKIFQGGLRMDWSTTSYIMSYIFSMLGLLWLTISKSLKGFFRFLIIVNVFLLIGITAIFIADVFLLKYWGCRINSQALSFLKFPIESMRASLSKIEIISISLGLLLLGFGCYLLIIKSENSIKRLTKKIKNTLSNWIYLIMTLGMLILGIRGGTSKVPLQISEAFVFAGDSDLNNQLTLNSLWNAIFQFTNKQKHPDVDHILEFDGNEQLWVNYSGVYDSDPQILETNIGLQESSNIHSDKSSTFPDKLHKFPNKTNIYPDKSNIFPDKSNTFPDKNKIYTDKPNIYLFVLEGVSAEVSEYFSDSKINATPLMDELAQNGIGFKQAFACGDRTDKGIATVLTGWPGQPWQSILNYPDKYKKLPSIIKSAKLNGYTSTFYYGGNSKFANIQDFLIQMGLDKIIDESEMNLLNMEFIYSKSSISSQIFNSFNANLSAKTNNNSKRSWESDIKVQKATSNSFELKGNWGYFDPVVMDVLQMKNTQSSKLLRNRKGNHSQPQFHIILTSSTHEPYDINNVFVDRKSVPNKNIRDKEIQNYIQSVRILDQSIYACIRRIQSSDPDALFILVSDHGKYLNTNETKFGQRNFFHIPLIFYGKPIDQIKKTIKPQYIDKLINRVVSQTDIASTIEGLLFQKSYSNQYFEYSRNVFERNFSEMSWFTMYGVMGIIEKDATYWLSTDKKSQELEKPWNYRDSMVLFMGKKIISDFFSL